VSPASERDPLPARTDARGRSVQDGRSLTSGAERHVLTGRRNLHGHPEHRRGDLANCFGLSAATDQYRAAKRHIESAQGVQASAEPRQHAFDGGAGQVFACCRGEGHAGEGSCRIRQIGRALPLEVREEGQARGSRLGGQR